MEISTWFNTNKVNSVHYTLDDIRKEGWTKKNKKRHKKRKLESLMNKVYTQWNNTYICIKTIYLDKYITSCHGTS